MTMLNEFRRTDVLRKLNPVRRGLGAGLGLFLALLATTVAVQAAPVGQEGNLLNEGVRIWPVLLPLLAASLVVERMIELIWNYIDWGVMNFRNMQPADLKSPEYMQFKSGTSLLLGVLFGILIANYMRLRIFSYFEPLAPSFMADVPGAWDVIVTGVLIGAGAKPVHDVLGILTKFKDFFDKSAIRQRELAGAAFADGVLKLAESETQSMVDVPGIGPTPLSASLAGEQAAAGMADDEEGATSHSAQQRYAEALRNRTAM